MQHVYEQDADAHQGPEQAPEQSSSPKAVSPKATAFSVFSPNATSGPIKSSGKPVAGAVATPLSAVKAASVGDDGGNIFAVKLRKTPNTAVAAEGSPEAQAQASFHNEDAPPVRKASLSPAPPPASSPTVGNGTSPTARPGSAKLPAPGTKYVSATFGQPRYDLPKSSAPLPMYNGEVPPSEHDRKNSHNVAQVLAEGSFKYVPLQDFIPYEELKALRVEDGIDATRKEDYLSPSDFEAVFGMSREDFKNVPKWKQVAAKKKAQVF